MKGRELVKAELIGDVGAIVPGKPFQAGLLLHLAPRWHTYWKYSGDAGIPDRIEVAPSAGLEGRRTSLADRR